MTQEDNKFLKEFYDTVIVTGLIKPLEMEQAYRMVCPDCADAKYLIKQRVVALYVQQLQKEVIAELEDLFSMSDKMLEETPTVLEETPTVLEVEETKTIEELEAEYVNASTTHKKKITRQINELKKQNYATESPE